MLTKFLNDDSGFILTAELVLVLTICVMGCIVGLSRVMVAINEELLDWDHAIGCLNQSFSLPGFRGVVKGNPICITFGCVNIDDQDDGDCNSSCDMIPAGTAINSNCG